jgi:hypothetical protein
MEYKKLSWVLAFLLVVSMALAARPHPEIYWGYVYVDGAPAADGTTLTVETALGELLTSKVLPMGADNASYSLKIKFDDDLTNETDEGADPGEDLVWKIDGVPATSPTNDTAVPGATNNNFTIEGITQPYITVVSNVYSGSVLFGNNISVNLTLDNSGSGDGNVTFTTNSSVPNDLPSDLFMTTPSQDSILFDFAPAACGVYNESVDMPYYDIYETLIDTPSASYDFEVNGADLIISAMNLSDAGIGQTLEIRATVTNNGTLNTSSFNTTLYIDSQEHDTMSSNYTLGNGDNLTLVFTWTVQSGSHTFRAEVENLDAVECNQSNNDDEISDSWTSGGGGSGGGSGGSGSSGSSTGDSTTSGRIDRFDYTNVSVKEESFGDDLIYDYAGGAESAKRPEQEDSITGLSVADLPSLPLDFITLLITFVAFVCMTSVMMMYKGNICFEQPGKDESVSIAENKKYEKQYSMVPFSQLNDSLKLVDSIHDTRMSYPDIKSKFSKKGYSSMMIELATNAVRNRSVVMKSQQDLLQELRELNIRRNSDYINYASLVSATKIIADLYKTQKEGQNIKEKIEEALK